MENGDLLRVSVSGDTGAPRGENRGKTRTPRTHPSIRQLLPCCRFGCDRTRLHDSGTGRSKC